MAQRGDLKGAEGELRRAVELAPDDPALLGSLGAILGMQQKLEESNVYLEKALKINPDDLATRRNLASNEFQLGHLQSAKENLKRILAVKPGDPTAVLLLGMVDEEMKDYASAAKLLSSVPDQVRQRPESLAALARAYYYTDQRAKARETLKELQGHPAGPEGVFLGGQVAAQADDLETAALMFGSIRTIYPDMAKLGYNLALVQYRANRIEESQTTLCKLVDAGYGTSDIFNLLGWCFHKQGNWKEAVKAMDLAIDRDPGRGSNYLDLAMILIEHRRLSVALAAARKAVEVAPSSYQAYRLKGLIESKLHYSLDAINSYGRAVELNPAAPEAILGLALAQMSEGKTQEAEATFKQAIERFPRQAVLYQEYGRMLILWGGNDAATESRAVWLLQTAITLDGTLAEPRFQLGKLALRKGNTEEALEQLEAAAKLSPKNRGVHYSLANLYRRLGRGKEASEELRIFESLKAEEEAVSGISTGESKSTGLQKGPAPGGTPQGPKHD